MLLVVFGILVSIPIVVWGSQLVLKLMDRYPIVITAGGALLGWIGGGMIVSDPALPVGLLSGVPYAKATAAVAGAVLVVVVGKWLAWRAMPRVAVELTVDDSSKGSS
jgi:predicted tellurium resistance membrane protein TerC